MWSKERVEKEYADVIKEVNALYLVKDKYGLVESAQDGLVKAVARAGAFQEVLELFVASEEKKV